METENAIQRHGRELFERVRGATPRVFSARHVTGRLMKWSMRDEQLKTELFRLVDVLPSLGSSREVASHIEQYLGHSRRLPIGLRAAVRTGKIFPWLAKIAAREGVRRMARQFILAENPEDAVSELKKLRGHGLAFTADLLGETVVSESEAQIYQGRYLGLLEVLGREAGTWPEAAQLNKAGDRTLPNVNISLKVSAMYSQLKPVDLEGGIAILSRRIRPILSKARELGAFINFDMESTALRPVTIELFKRLLSEAEFGSYPHFGIALQCYLRSSEDDLRELISWGNQGGKRFTIRLIKGAYWDYETAVAAQRNWPCPVFIHKIETDAQYEKLARIMLENRQVVDCAFGTHNIRSISACMGHAAALGIPAGEYEFQMLYGMAEPIKEALVQMGHCVRDYCPIGEILAGMSYLVRRLLENSSNEGFLRGSFAEGASVEALLKNPAEVASALEQNGEDGAGLFQNTPLTDWTIEENRERMRRAIESVRRTLGRKHALIVGGKPIVTGRWITSMNPAKPREVIGSVAEAGRSEAAAAIAEAERAFKSWRFTSPEERAGLLERAADLLAAQRLDLAAVEIFETGKNWGEADADVAEAIDFCRFYASEMRRLAGSHVNLPGESNLHTYIPLGIGVVIAPWNFPLAILCGMTSAALVAGNCVIIKPAEQSSVVGSRFAEILREAGFPPGTFAFLPGKGEEIGPFLVEHGAINFIAFTGSREVGTKIWQSAAIVQAGQNHLKKVVCEMGGKNAMIIDSDADLDEAIPAVLQSAFGYGGQKCSALSRLILLQKNREPFLRRLVEAVASLRIGPPESPGTTIGPLISREAQERVLDYIETGRKESRLLYLGPLPGELDGWFVPPAIFVDVPPDARIAREEIFGPLLAIFSAENLDEAISLANGTDYALTAGIFSRSPRNIERLESELLAGNIYINRPITGALVGRQPFGGFKMSGGGTKAGGRDYLLQFMHPKVVTENTLRRGFAPVEKKPGD